MEFVKTYDEKVQAYSQNIFIDFYEADNEDDTERIEEIAKSINIDVKDLYNIRRYIDLIIKNPDIDDLMKSYYKFMNAVEEKARNA